MLNRVKHLHEMFRVARHDSVHRTAGNEGTLNYLRASEEVHPAVAHHERLPAIHQNEEQTA
jgi:hypothetical protein